MKSESRLKTVRNLRHRNRHPKKYLRFRLTKKARKCRYYSYQFWFKSESESELASLKYLLVGIEIGIKNFFAPFGIGILLINCQDSAESESELQP